MDNPPLLSQKETKGPGRLLLRSVNRSIPPLQASPPPPRLFAEKGIPNGGTSQQISRQIGRQTFRQGHRLQKEGDRKSRAAREQGTSRVESPPKTEHNWSLACIHASTNASMQPCSFKERKKGGEGIQTNFPDSTSNPSSLSTYPTEGAPPILRKKSHQRPVSKRPTGRRPDDSAPSASSLVMMVRPSYILLSLPPLFLS